jgi:CubicO group peptidase (beta-lactamase class C family)
MPKAHMKKIILLISIALGMLIFWTTEPFANIPFYQPDLPSTKTAVEYTCETGNENIEDMVGSVLDTYMQSGDFLGVSAGFLKEGCGWFSASAGYSSKRGLTEFEPDTITRIASITKPMTAIAIMQLFEKGKIDLDAPIQIYLPEFPDTAKPVTIRHLLNHTSGIPHYKSKLDAISFTHYPSLKLAADAVYERGFFSPPGETYEYSSFGYTVLGSVIENVTGIRFEEYLKKNIWDKAGMQHTSLEKSHRQKNKSRLYVKVGGTFIRSPYSDLSLIYPAGGVQSTAIDLLKFGEAVISNKLISRTTLEMMIDVSDSLAPLSGDDPYGLGWTVYEDAELGRIISHGGAQPGASAQFLILLDKGAVSTVLSNAFGTKNSAWNLAFAMAHLGMNLQPSNHQIQPSTEAAED